jgi:hypothetical protein
LVGVKQVEVRSPPVNTSLDEESLVLDEPSSDEALLTGEQSQKCDPNSREASVQKNLFEN